MPGRRHTGSPCRSAPVSRRSGPSGTDGALEGSSLGTGQRLLTAQPIGKGPAALSAPDSER
eukprot:12683123-Alexandrium_andersonii.AAC.1